jgi:hypothetical protein
MFGRRLLLMRLTLSVALVITLRNRATADGISNDLIEDARDADDPKAALLDLIVAQARPKQGP